MNEKFFRMNSLLDFYGSLLSEKQNKAAYMYYVYDCTINEISSELNISKQAVFDNLKRAENNLEDFESKLSLLSNSKKDLDIKEMKNKKLKAIFKSIEESYLEADLAEKINELKNIVLD